MRVTRIGLGRHPDRPLCRHGGVPHGGARPALGAAGARLRGAGPAVWDRFEVFGPSATDNQYFTTGPVVGFVSRISPLPWRSWSRPVWSCSAATSTSGVGDGASSARPTCPGFGRNRPGDLLGPSCRGGSRMPLESGRTGQSAQEGLGLACRYNVALAHVSGQGLSGALRGFLTLAGVSEDFGESHQRVTL